LAIVDVAVEVTRSACNTPFTKFGEINPSVILFKFHPTAVAPKASPGISRRAALIEKSSFLLIFYAIPKISKFGAIAQVIVVVPVQFIVVSLETFCFVTPSIDITLGAAANTNTVLDPFTVPVGVWNPTEAPPFESTNNRPVTESMVNGKTTEASVFDAPPAMGTLF
jgi:hypothetical protein